jgi:hypothetical protein
MKLINLFEFQPMKRNKKKRIQNLIPTTPSENEPLKNAKTRMYVAYRPNVSEAEAGTGNIPSP